MSNANRERMHPFDAHYNSQTHIPNGRRPSEPSNGSNHHASAPTRLISSQSDLNRSEDRAVIMQTYNGPPQSSVPVHHQNIPHSSSSPNAAHQSLLQHPEEPRSRQRGTYMGLQTLRNIFSRYPSSLYSAGRRENRRHEHQTTNNNNSNDGTPSPPHKGSGSCPRNFITALLLFSSFAALGTSGFLMYKYHTEPRSYIVEAPVKAYDCVAQLDHCAEKGDVNCTTTWSKCYKLRQGMQPSAHIQIGRPESRSSITNMTVYKPMNHPEIRTHSHRISCIRSGLEVEFEGRYYIYFSITAIKQFSKNTRATLTLQVPARRYKTVLTRSEHVWCEECSENSRATMYDGGVFHFNKGDQVVVIVSKEAGVGQFSYLGMFLV